LIYLNLSDFSYIEDYLSKFNTIIILLEDYKIENKDDQLRYVILANLGSEYSIFVSTFHSTREALGVAYTPHYLEVFCDSSIREKDSLLHIQVIKTTSTYNK
jgi:hypothetical protein